MTNESTILIEAIRIVPGLAWVALVGLGLYWFKDPIKQSLLPRTSGVKAFGVEFSFAQQQLEATVKKQEPTALASESSQVMRRAQLLNRYVAGVRVLWVDDHPGNIVHETQILSSLGMLVQHASHTDEALRLLERGPVDIVISDMKRGTNEQAGIELLNAMRTRRCARPLIFYAASFDPSKGVPPHAFGMTNRADHLLNLLFDVVERERV